MAQQLFRTTLTVLDDGSRAKGTINATYHAHILQTACLGHTGKLSARYLHTAPFPISSMSREEGLVAALQTLVLALFQCKLQQDKNFLTKLLFCSLGAQQEPTRR